MHADQLFSCNDPVLLAKCPRVCTFCFQLDSGHPNGHDPCYGQLHSSKRVSALPVSHDVIATH